MKTFKLLLSVLVTGVFSSCASVYFYQVYKAVPISKMEMQSNSLVYEDQNCKVSYDLWKDGGNIGFLFQNKTSEDIYINLNESFFILNGISNKYYQHRIFTNTTNKAISKSRSATLSTALTGFNIYDVLQTNRFSVSNLSSAISSSGYSVSFAEEDLVCVPSGTSKMLSEFSINESLIRDCNLLRYPANNKDIKTKNYSLENSPLAFSNRIVYQVGKGGKSVKFENQFFVSTITNYNAKQMFELKNEEFCGEKSLEKTKYHKYNAPDKFFIEYTKTTDSFKH